MKSCVFTFTLVLFLACTNNDASNIADRGNYYDSGRISGSVSQLHGQSVLLFELYGDQVNLIDTAIVDEDGSFEFFFPPGRDNGLYRIAMGKSTNTGKPDHNMQQFDLIWNGNEVIFNTNYAAPVDSMDILVSKENKLYYQYLQRMRIFDKKMGVLNYALLNYPSEDRFYRRVERQHRRIQNQRLNYIDNLVNNNSETIFASIAYFLKPLRISSPNNTGQLDEIKQDFFKEGIFDDPILLHTDLIPKKIIRYLSLYTAGEYGDSDDKQEDMIVAVDNIMEHAMAREEIFYFVTEYLINGFESMDMELVSEHISRKYLLGDICFEEDIRRGPDSLSSIEEIEEGSRVPDFSFTSADGRLVDLHGIDAKYTLILFWGSWCPHCRDIMDDLYGLYMDYNNKSDNFLEIVAIGIEDDEQAWLDYIEKGGYDWINYSSLQRWDCPVARDFGLHGTPTMILLDNDKRFLQEPARVRALNRYLSRQQ